MMLDLIFVKYLHKRFLEHPNTFSGARVWAVGWNLSQPILVKSTILNLFFTLMLNLVLMFQYMWQYMCYKYSTLQYSTVHVLYVQYSTVQYSACVIIKNWNIIKRFKLSLANSEIKKIYKINVSPNLYAAIRSTNNFQISLHYFGSQLN